MTHGASIQCSFSSGVNVMKRFLLEIGKDIDQGSPAGELAMLLAAAIVCHKPRIDVPEAFGDSGKYFRYGYAEADELHRHLAASHVMAVCYSSGDEIEMSVSLATMRYVFIIGANGRVRHTHCNRV